MASKNINGDVNVQFTEASSRQSLETGESVKTLFGKLRKWLSDLKPVAFSGSYNDLSNKPTIPDISGKADKSTLDELTQKAIKRDANNDVIEEIRIGNITATRRLMLSSNGSATLQGLNQVKIGAGTAENPGIIEISATNDDSSSQAISIKEDTSGNRIEIGKNDITLLVGNNALVLNSDGLKYNGITLPVANNAGYHNSVFRGKYLGSSFTSAQKAAIANGTFDDLFVGDYWTINGVNWRIADIDYFFNFGDTKCLTHHLVIVPDYQITTGKMNSSNSTSTAYTSSYMRATILQQNGNESSSSVLGKIKAAFGSSYILSHRSILCNGVSSGSPSAWAWYDSKVDLLNQCMVYGSSVWESASKNGMSLGIETSQLQLFKLARQFVMNMSGTSSNGYWLRDIYNAECFCYVASNGTAHALYGQASGTMGVRPYFCLKGA